MPTCREAGVKNKANGTVGFFILKSPKGEKHEAELCNGSTNGSDPFSLGSNPSSAARKNANQKVGIFCFQSAEMKAFCEKVQAAVSLMQANMGSGQMLRNQVQTQNQPGRQPQSQTQAQSTGNGQPGQEQCQNTAGSSGQGPNGDMMQTQEQSSGNGRSGLNSQEQNQNSAGGYVQGQNGDVTRTQDQTQDQTQDRTTDQTCATQPPAGQQAGGDTQPQGQLLKRKCQ